MSSRKKSLRWLLFAYAVLLVASHVWRALHPVVPEPSASQRLATLGETALSYSDISRAAPATQSPIPVVLLHGSPMASACFRDLAPLLSDDFRLVIPDLPGFGNSRAVLPGPDLSSKAHAESVAALLDFLEIPTAHIVGYSMGGAVAIELQRLAPQKIESITLLSSVGVQEQELLGDYTLNHAIHGLQLLALKAVQGLLPHFGLMDRSLIDVAYGQNFFYTDQRPYREILTSIPPTKPVLIIHAEDDFLVPFSAAEEHARIIPHSEAAFFEHGGHMALVFTPEAIAGPLRKFLQKASPEIPTPERLAAAALPATVRKLGSTPLALLGVMILLALATFVSEDLTCLSAGILVATGSLGFLPAAGACVLGIFFGDLWLYVLGRTVGAKAITKAPLRWLLPEKRLTFGRDWFESHAASLIFASRFLPGTRLPLYFSAGVAKVRPSRFLLWFLLAALVWTPLLVGGAALAGKPLLAWFARYEDHALWGLAALALAIFLLFHLIIPLFTWKGRRLLLGKWRRISRWEFWPMAFFYPPIIVHILWLALKHRSLTLFTAANPGIPCGGLVMESKLEILTALESSGAVARFAPVQSTTAIADQGFTYPLVLKPDLGERGAGVAVIHTAEEAEAYLASTPPSQITIAQEFIPGLEFGVFYIRHPDAPEGHIFSITEKHLTSVTGDNTSTLEELILADPRAFCMAPFFLDKLTSKLHSIPASGETVHLTSLGTHSRGALFLDGAGHITPALTAEIERISRTFPGFHFGRYDLRVPSLEDFHAGRNLKILELNGVTSEATHIYDPAHGLLHAYRTLRHQWRHCFEIGQKNAAAGHPPATFSEIRTRLHAFREKPVFEA